LLPETVIVRVVLPLLYSTFGVELSVAGEEPQVDHEPETESSTIAVLKLNGPRLVIEFPDPSPPP
jgi:hypothetical protein